MGFKEMVADDIENVFENLEEFADTHTWNGGSGKSYTITAVVDDDKLSVAIGKRGKNAKLAVKLTNRKIDIYTIDEIQEDMGMYAIFLSRGK